MNQEQRNRGASARSLCAGPRQARHCGILPRALLRFSLGPASFYFDIAAPVALNVSRGQGIGPRTSSGD